MTDPDTPTTEPAASVSVVQEEPTKALALSLDADAERDDLYESLCNARGSLDDARARVARNEQRLEAVMTPQARTAQRDLDAATKALDAVEFEYSDRWVDWLSIEGRSPKLAAAIMPATCNTGRSRARARMSLPFLVQEMFGETPPGRVITGLPTLDEATRGGLPFGSVVIVGGAPGASKTSHRAHALLPDGAARWRCGAQTR
jgi:hypothetical protein